MIKYLNIYSSSVFNDKKKFTWVAIIFDTLCTTYKYNVLVVLNLKTVQMNNELTIVT